MLSATYEKNRTFLTLTPFSSSSLKQTFTHHYNDLIQIYFTPHLQLKLFKSLARRLVSFGTHKYRTQIRQSYITQVRI